MGRMDMGDTQGKLYLFLRFRILPQLLLLPVNQKLVSFWLLHGLYTYYATCIREEVSGFSIPTMFKCYNFKTKVSILKHLASWIQLSLFSYCSQDNE